MDNKSQRPNPPENAGNPEQESSSPFDILEGVQFGDQAATFGENADALRQETKDDAAEAAFNYDQLRQEKDQRQADIAAHDAIEPIPFTTPNTHNERLGNADVELGRYLSLIDPSQQEAISFVQEPGVVDFLNDTQIAGYTPITDDMVPALRGSFEAWKGQQSSFEAPIETGTQGTDLSSESPIFEDSNDRDARQELERRAKEMGENSLPHIDDSIIDEQSSSEPSETGTGGSAEESSGDKNEASEKSRSEKIDALSKDYPRVKLEVLNDEDLDFVYNFRYSDKYSDPHEELSDRYLDLVGSDLYGLNPRDFAAKYGSVSETSGDSGDARRRERLEIFGNIKEASDWLAQKHGMTRDDLEGLDSSALDDIWAEYVNDPDVRKAERVDVFGNIKEASDWLAQKHGMTRDDLEGLDLSAVQDIWAEYNRDPDVIASGEQGGTTENGSENGDGGSNNEPSDESAETTEGHSKTLEELIEERKQNLLRFLNEPHRADWLARKHGLTVDDIKDRDVDEIQALWDEFLDDSLSSGLNDNSDENAGEGATGENGGGSEEQGSLENEESEEGASEDESAGEDDEDGDEEEEESAGSESGEEEEALDEEESEEESSAEDEEEESAEEEESSDEDEESEKNFERDKALDAFFGEAAEWLGQNHGELSADDLENMSDEELEALWDEYQNSESEEEEESAEEGESGPKKTLVEFLAEKGITGEELRSMDPKKLMELLNEYDLLNGSKPKKGETGGESSEDEELEKNYEREKALDFFFGEGAEWLGQNHGELSADNLENMSDEELEALWNEYIDSLGGEEEESASEEEESAEDEEKEKNYEREEVLDIFFGEGAEWLGENHGEISAEDLENMDDEELEALWREYLADQEEEEKRSTGEEEESGEDEEEPGEDEEESGEDEESEEEEKAEHEVITIVNAMAEEDARIAAGIIAEQAYNEEINGMARFNPVRLWRQSRPGRAFRMKYYNAEAMDKLRSIRNGENPNVPLGFWNERDVIAKFTMAYMENLENEMVHSDAGEMMRGYTVRVGEDGTETVIHRRRNEKGEIEEVEILRRDSDGNEKILAKEGEGSDEMLKDARAAIQTKDAIRRFAKSAGDDAAKKAFLSDIANIKVNTLGLTENQSDFTMDNYLEAAVAARDKISHGIAMDRVLDGFNYINAESRSQVRTEVEKTNIDSLAAKISMRTHGLIAPETAAAVIGFGSGYLLSGAKAAAKAGIVVGGVALGAAVPAAMPLVAGALISGVWGGINEANRVKRDQSRTLRDMAMGSSRSTLNKNSHNPFIRGRLKYDEQLRAANYDSQPANGLKEALNKAIASGNSDEIMRQLAAIDTRIKLSDSNGIDLISYTSGESIVNERANLDIARARARIALREAGVDPAKSSVYSDAYTSSMESLNKNMTDTKKAQGKLRRKRAIGHGVKSAAIAAVASVIGQEVRAAFDDDIVGVFESDAANNAGASRTLLGSARERFFPTSDPNIGLGKQLTAQEIAALQQQGYTVSQSGSIPGGTNSYDVKVSTSEFAEQKGDTLSRHHFGNGTRITDHDEGRTYQDPSTKEWFTGFRNEITDGNGNSRDWRDIVNSGRVRAYYTPGGVGGGKAVELNVETFTDNSGMPQIRFSSDIPEIQAGLDQKLGMVEIGEYLGTNPDGTVNANIFSTWPGKPLTGDVTETITEQLPDIPVYGVTSPDRAIDYLHPVIIPTSRTEAGPAKRGTGHTALDSLNPTEEEEEERRAGEEEEERRTEAEEEEERRTEEETEAETETETKVSFTPSKGEKIEESKIDDIAESLGKPFENPIDRARTVSAVKFWNRATEDERKKILDGTDKTSNAARWALQYLVPRGLIDMEPSSE